MTEQQRLVLRLAPTISADPKEIGRAIALARTGRTDLIAAVMAGRVDLRSALQAAKSSNRPSRIPSRAR